MVAVPAAPVKAGGEHAAAYASDAVSAADPDLAFHRMATPISADRIEATKTAILAAAKSGALGSACPAMNNDMVKPMPASAPGAAELTPGILGRLDRRTELHGKDRGDDEAQRFADDEARGDGGHQQLAAGEDVRGDDDPGVGQGEQRQHDIAGARAGVAQQAVGGRLDAIVDGVERIERRLRRAVPQHLVAMPRLHLEDRRHLAHQAPEVGRRPRRDEQRKNDAGQRGVQAARQDARPQRDAEQHIRLHEINVRPIEGGEHGDDGGGGEEIFQLQVVRIEHRHDRNGADVVDDRRGGEEDAQPTGTRLPIMTIRATAKAVSVAIGMPQPCDQSPGGMTNA